MGEVKGSAHKNMKELIASKGGTGGALRVLFVFDPRRTAILLIGGNKAGLWDEWYVNAVPIGDAAYETYLDELRKEGLI